MRRDRVLRIGGLVAGGVLAVFGLAVIVLSVWGHSTVAAELKDQKITGTPDMSPAATRASLAAAGLHDISVPSCDVAGKPIDSGTRARCFAQYMNVHALKATGGYVYSEMGIYAAKPDAPKSALLPGGGTNDPKQAQVDPKTGQPVQNGARNIWVSETALSTALNVSFFATAVSLFGLVVGFALLLAGVGFIILALRVLPWGAAPEAAAAAAPV